MFYYRSGDKVTVTVLRDGREHQISLEVGTPPVTETASARIVPQFPSINSPGQPPTIVPAAASR
jgi:hypothetical protein